VFYSYLILIVTVINWKINYGATHIPISPPIVLEAGTYWASLVPQIAGIINKQNESSLVDISLYNRIRRRLCRR
jgi:hypothetical protein